MFRWTLRGVPNQPDGLLAGKDTVGADGKLALGPCGSISVAGLTVEQANAAIEKHLVQYARNLWAGANPLPKDNSGSVATRVAQNGEPSRGAVTQTGWRTNSSPLATNSANRVGALTPPSAHQFESGNLVTTTVPTEPTLEELHNPTPVAPSTDAVTIGSPVPMEHVPHHPYVVKPGAAPRELAKVSLPPYVIEPPDILLVETTAGLKVQPIRGQHLVRPDGTISLGIYGAVYVAGMTIEQAKEVIARQILNRIKVKRDEETPKDLNDLELVLRELNVDVLAYNSKFYYVITDGGGYGEQVIPLPVTGSETILDAIGKINGLPPPSSKNHIWVARRTGANGGQILPVDWCAISQGGSTATNYQIMPGDRIYVKADKWVRFDSAVAKRVSPFERLFGITLLGSSTVNSIRNRGTTTGQ
jgi:polysaccharide export outer membrane protein